MHVDDSMRPLAAVVFAIALLSIMDALVKLAAADFNTWQIVLLRYASGLAFIAPVYAYSTRAWPRRSTWRNSAVRALSAAATAVCFFYALSVVPLVKAVALSFSAPLFMLAIARLVLGEPFNARALAAIALGTAGVLAMLWQPLMESASLGNLVGEGAVLLAAFFYALAIVLTRLHGQSDGAHAMVFTQSICITLYALPLGLTYWQPLDFNATLLFLAVGLLGTTANILMAWGFARAPASRLGPMEYTNLLWTSILGYALFAEIPTLFTVAGAGLIIAASLLAARRATP